MSRGCNRGDCGGVWRVVVDTVARWILGGVLLFSGAVKSVDPVGTSLYVDKYLATYSLEALLPLSEAIAVVLAVAEFALGVLLILGYHRRVTITFTLILTSIFFVVTLLSATLLPIGDCGVMIMTLTAHICSVFSYKLRFLQARVCIITALLALGMQVWFFMDFLKFRNDMVFSITMVFPLVMTILDVMAARNSLVDEMTVSAVRSVRKIRRRR